MRLVGVLAWVAVAFGESMGGRLPALDRSLQAACSGGESVSPPDISREKQHNFERVGGFVRHYSRVLTCARAHARRHDRRRVRRRRFRGARHARRGGLAAVLSGATRVAKRRQRSLRQCR